MNTNTQLKDIKELLANNQFLNTENLNLLELKLGALKFNFEKLESDRNIIVSEIEIILLSYQGLTLYLNSFLLSCTHDQRYLTNIFDYIESDGIAIEEFHYVYWQLTRILFVAPELKTDQNIQRLRGMYHSYFDFFNNQISNEDYWIPLSERNQDLVIVIVGQMLSLTHSPTQVAMDQCKALHDLQKRILLINTADMPRSQITPFFEASLFNYDDQYNTMEKLKYEDVNISFYQFEKEMPNSDEIIEVLQTVKQLKPLFVLSVSGSNVTADLLSNIVPVVTSSLSYDLPISESTFSILPRKLVPSDYETLKLFGKPVDSIIESVFTYKYNPPKTRFVRTDFGFGDDHFIMAVVGNRLDLEISDDYLLELKNLVQWKDNIQIMFIGEYEGYQKVTDQQPWLKEHSIHAGFQNDLAAVLGICDAYLNPYRAGGGTSAAIALKQGLSIFTYAYGDVAYTAGDSYHINSFEDIKNFIENYDDLQFRANVRTAAMSRAEEIFNSEKKLKDIIKTMSVSPYFA